MKAAYFAEGEILAEMGRPDDLVEFCYDRRQLAYIRLIPTKKQSAPIPLATLTEVAPHMPLLRRGHGAICRHNRFGAIAFEPDSHPRKGRTPLKASTQLFRNGELWSIGTEVIVTDRGHRPRWLNVPFVNSLPFEQLFRDTLYALLETAKSHLGLLPPWQVELGLVCTESVYVVGMLNDEQWGPIHRPEIIHRIALNNDISGCSPYHPARLL